MKIFRVISAAKCAVQDRYHVTRGAKGKYPLDSKNYYRALVKVSGPSTHNPIQIVKNLYTAYQYNVERIKNAEQILYMSNETSLITKFFNRMFKK